MKKTILTILLFTGFAFASCTDEGKPESENKKIAIDRKGSCVINLNQIDSSKYTILHFADSVFDKNGRFLQFYSHIDTLPTLGMVTDTLDTNRTYEDANGDEYYVDTLYHHIKPYQLFITVTKK